MRTETPTHKVLLNYLPRIMYTFYILLASVVVD